MDPILNPIQITNTWISCVNEFIGTKNNKIKKEFIRQKITITVSLCKRKTIC